MFEKRRPPPMAGSIPEALDMWRSEVRFNLEIAPVVEVVRVPRCASAEVFDDGSTRLVFEDLSGLRPGGSPSAVARDLRRLHERWAGQCSVRWPWLRRVGAAADLIAALYDAVWNASLSHRADLPPIVRSLGASLEGRVVDAELAEGRAGPLTLCHGDACAKNVFTDADGTIVFVDWEDVRCASGVVDLAWLLVSSVEPAAWDDVIAAYGADGCELATVLPAAAAQGLMAMADAPVDGELAQGWTARLAAAGARIAAR